MRWKRRLCFDQLSARYEALHAEAWSATEAERMVESWARRDGSS